MGRATTGGLKAQRGMRWPLGIAGLEFGVNERTISARLASAGIRSDPDGTYSTADILGAIIGDRNAEKKRREKLESDALQLENEQAAGLVVSTAGVVDWAEMVASEIRRVVTGFRSITPAERDKILVALAAAAIGDTVPQSRRPAV